MYLNLFKRQKRLNYVVENAEWSIAWDGRYITKGINKQTNIKASVTTDYKIAKNSILHFGSRFSYLKNAYLDDKILSRNRNIFTWFHGTEEDTELIQKLPEGVKKVEFVHTSCTISKELLTKWGVPSEKIVIVPLGVDLQIFKQNKYDGQQLRRYLGIEENAFIIGSFQKDDIGWNNSGIPKLEKGPDILCDVLEKLAQKHKIFVFLTGPSREYVKNRLKKASIPFQHVFLQNYLDIAQYYSIIDLYIVSSRAEGGPKGPLEAIASGVPVVSTKVGLVPDIFDDGKDILTAEINDVDGLVDRADELIKNEKLRTAIITKGLQTIKKYDWDKIALQYYNKMYKYLI